MTDREELGRLADRLSDYRVWNARSQRYDAVPIISEAAQHLRRLAEAGTQEAVAWLRHKVDGDGFATCDEDDDGAFAVYAAAPPAPSVAVKVKPLVWQHDGNQSYAFCDVTETRWVARNPDERKAAEARREQRITSALITAPQDDVRDGPTLAMETRRADDNAESCRQFCAALRRIAFGAPDAATIAADAVKMPWLLEPLPSDTTPSRPEVDVEELRDFIYVRQPCYSMDLARALKAKFEVHQR